MTLTLTDAPAPEAQPVRRRSWLGEPGWARPALWALLAGTAVLYLWNLSASGFGNDFYAGRGCGPVRRWR